MTRIDFYVLGEHSRVDRFVLACRVAEKAYLQDHRVYLHATSVDEARHLDRLLWTFRDGSFVPHALAEGAHPAPAPVMIGWQDAPQGESDVLVNLAPQVPDFFSRFHRVAEPIDNEPGVREAGRDRYRFYRDRGYPLQYHDLGKA